MDLLATLKSEPVVPGFAKAVARGLVLLSQFVALHYLREDSFHGKIVRIDDCISCSNGSCVMGVAGCSHGQTTNLCIFEGVAVVSAKRCRGIENLDGVNR